MFSFRDACADPWPRSGSRCWEAHISPNRDHRPARQFVGGSILAKTIPISRLIILIAVRFLIAISCLNAEAAVSINLHNVASNWEKYKAPPGIQRRMERLKKKELAACIENFPETPKRDKLERRIFSAVRIDIAGKDDATFLVVSPPKCRELRGVHARSYWILLVLPTGDLRVLLESADDRIQIEDSRTIAFRDITTYYGTNSSCRYLFDGLDYKRLPPTRKHECL